MKQQHRRNTVLGLGLALQLSLAATGLVSAIAAEPDPSQDSAFMRFCKRDYMFGDWGGLRTNLKEHGVDFEFLYFGAVPSNLSGGIKDGSVYEGAFMMMMDLYSDKLVGYEGGQFHVAGISMHNGPEFSLNYVGDLNKVSLLDFPDNLCLWELWYEQKFCDDKVALKAGQLAIDRDFILPEFYNSLAGISFLNQTFFYPTVAFNVWDQPGFPKGNHGLASTPYGTPGARLRIDPSPYAYFQIGGYSAEVDTSRGDVRFPISERSGALIYSELTLKLNQSPEAQGPPGNLKFGGWYATGDFYDTYDSALYATIALADPSKYHGNYGLYFLADQTLWQEEGKEDPAHQGLVGFFRVAGAPPDRNLAPFGIDGGLVYRGLIPSRDWDSLGLAVSYLEISHDIRDAQDDVNTLFGAKVLPEADYEAVIELSYKAQLTAWWTLQPSLQRVFHPGGQITDNTPDAWVAIIQTMLRF